MLSCAGVDRLQTAMRGASGKLPGTDAHVHIWQSIMSVRSSDRNMVLVIETFRRADNFKSPGAENISVSKILRFMKYDREHYEELRDDGRLDQDDRRQVYARAWNMMVAWEKVQRKISYS